MLLHNGIYEYVAVYVDDLLMAAQDWSKIIKALCDQHKFKLKGMVPLQYHLGVKTLRTTLVPYVFVPQSTLQR
jgi:hypothetical protein